MIEKNQQDEINIYNIQMYKPFAMAAFLGSRHARMTRAPLFARSSAVSLPMPVFAPVMMTVFPVNFFVLVQTPVVRMRYAFMTPNTTKISNPIWVIMDNEHTEFNIFLKQIVSAVCQDYGEV